MESNTSTKPLIELVGRKIVSIEVINGGSIFCDRIEIRLDKGVLLWVNRYLDVNQAMVQSKIQYRLGKWVMIEKLKVKEKQTFNQPCKKKT